MTALPESRKSQYLIRKKRLGAIRGVLLACCTWFSTVHSLAAEERLPGPEQWRAASGIMRLAALQKDGLTIGKAPIARAVLLQMGYGSPQRRLVSHDLRITPTFGYDSNLNGGFSGDRLTIGGLPAFTLAPEIVARPGLSAGLRLDAHADWALAPRVTAGLALHLRHSRALSATYFKSGIALRGCLNRLSGGQSVLRLCADAGSSHSPQSISHSRGLEAGVSHGFVMGRALLDADTWLRHEFALSAGQWQGGLGLRAVMTSGQDFGISYSMAAPVAGELVSRHALSLHAGFALSGAPMRVSATWSEADGGWFMGQPRREITRSLVVSRSFRIGWKGRGPVILTPSLRWFETRAGHDLLNREGVDMFINVQF